MRKLESGSSSAGRERPTRRPTIAGSLSAEWYWPVFNFGYFAVSVRQYLCWVSWFLQTQTKNVFGANIQEASNSSKGKVSILDSRGLEVGEVECRDKEPCLSRGGKGTALAVQLRGDQVHCLLVANISSLNSWAWFGWTLSLFRSNFRQNNFCPLVGNVQNCSFGFGRKR